METNCFLHRNVQSSNMGLEPLQDFFPGLSRLFLVEVRKICAAVGCRKKCNSVCNHQAPELQEVRRRPLPPCPALVIFVWRNCDHCGSLWSSRFEKNTA